MKDSSSEVDSITAVLLRMAQFMCLFAVSMV